MSNQRTTTVTNNYDEKQKTKHKIEMRAIRGHLFITFAKFPGFWTPSSLCSHFTKPTSIFVHKIDHFCSPSQPLGANIIRRCGFESFYPVNITKIKHHLLLLIIGQSMLHLKRPDTVMFVRPFDVSSVKQRESAVQTHKAE